MKNIKYKIKPKASNSYIYNLKNIFFRTNIKNIILLLSILIPICFQKQLLSDIETSKFDFEKNKLKWERFDLEKKYEKDILWKKIENTNKILFPNKEVNKEQESSENNNMGISTFNRSIVFDNSIIGPDVSWIVPPGFKWNNKYKFDASVRGHNRRKKGEKFFAWNSGDAVGQFYYQFFHNEKNSFGFNLGVRSIYEGSAAGGSTPIGEGQSLGFRLDRQISSTKGFSFGGEQLLQFDGLSDTGRDFYLSISKALWSNNKHGQFPLDIYTFGVATGKMAEGNIKFLCSNLFGGSGTERLHQRKLCWAPVFAISRVFNKNISTFFEYNSKFFLLGTSIIPFNEIPMRGTFAIQLSDHIDNYKLKDFDELKWVFRLSLGF